MTHRSIDWNSPEHIIQRMEEEREDLARMALIGYIVALALGFTLGIALF